MDTPPGVGVQRLVPAARARTAAAPGRGSAVQEALRPGQSKDRLAVPGMQPPGREDRCAPGHQQRAVHGNGARYGAAAGAGQKLNRPGCRRPGGIR